MKKCLLVLLIFAVIGGTAFALDILSYPPPLSRGNNILIDAGMGLNYFSRYGKMTILPIILSAEYALPNVPISVGAFGAYYQYKWTLVDYYDYGYRFNFYTFGARANWHWGFDMKRLDLYTGLWLGYRIHQAEWFGSGTTYSHGNYSGFDGGAQVGAHFYFTDNFGLLLESGYPFFLKMGLALKIEKK